jgi:hypothetical protein
MQHHNSILLSTALVLGAFGGSAHAASLVYEQHSGSAGYFATTDGNAISGDGDDLSDTPSDVYLFSAGGHDSTVQGGSLAHTYAADAQISFAGGGADLFMGLSHSLDGVATGSFAAVHQQDVFVEMGSVMFRIEGGAGEAGGSAVRLQFTGLASALWDTTGAAVGPYLGMGMSVAQGDSVLGEYLWDVQASGEQAVSFGFTAYVGQTYTFSGFMVSGVGLDGGVIGNGSIPISALSASLGGSFAVTPVPEPETVAMLLAGLAVLGAAAQRERQRPRG